MTKSFGTVEFDAEINENLCYYVNQVYDHSRTEYFIHIYEIERAQLQGD